VPKLEITNETINFIKQWEGFAPTAYWDYHQWSIGYGTISYEGQTITQEAAHKALGSNLRKYAKNLEAALEIQPTPNQTTALLSASYNLGVTGIKDILRLYNKGKIRKAAKELLRYDHAGGKKLSALTRRRKAEAKLLSSRASSIHPMVAIMSRGQPRTQYKRTYHLLSPDSSIDDFVSVAREAYEERGTIGFSYDDAGIGDLAERVVILHGNHPPDIEDWFEEHYQGIKVVNDTIVAPKPPEPPTGQTKALVGLHGSADGSWGNPILPETTEMIKEGKIEAYKGLSNESADTVKVLKDINPDMFILIRLFAKVNKHFRRPQQFVNLIAEDALKWYKAGVRHFEVHNEPNLKIDESAEGMWDVWKDGAEFSLWFLSVVAKLRQLMPDAKFGYPGLSPGFSMAGVRYDPIRFFNESWTAVDEADFICAHCYWVTRDQIYSDDHGQWYKRYHNKNKPIMITEFSNPSPEVPKHEKGLQYVEYYASLHNVHSAYSFISTSSSGFKHETWHGSDIATLVGQRNGR